MKLLNIPRKKWLDILIIVIYSIITLLVLLRHEPWRDEAQPWLLAKNANLFNLFFHEVRCQRHPFLWYLTLLPFARLGLPYITLSIVHWIIAISVSSIFIFKSHFSRITKYSFLFSYFMFHEYVILARHYALSILILFIIASFYSQRLKRPLFFGILVFLLFNSTFFFFGLAFSIMLLFLWENIKENKINKHSISALVIMCVGGIISFLTGAMLPKTHNQYGLITFEPSFDNVLSFLSRPFFIVYWDVPLKVAVLFGIIVFLLFFLSSVKKPKIFFLSIMSTLGPLYILAFRHAGSLRHYGLSIIIILFCLWISKEYKECDFKNFKLANIFPTKKIRMACIVLITISMLVSIKYAIWASKMEWRLMFSGAKATANAIEMISEKLDFRDHVIVAHPANRAASVAAFLPEREFWYADLQEYGTYWKHVKALDNKLKLSPGEIIVRAGTKFKNLSNVFLLLSRPFPIKNAFGYEFKLIFSADKRVWGYDQERYYLYKLIPITAK